MACCEALERRVADPDEEDRRSGRFIFVNEDSTLDMYIDSGEMITFNFCPFCGVEHSA